MRKVFNFVQVISDDFFHFNSYRPNIVALRQQGNNHRFCNMNLPDIECQQNSERIKYGEFEAKYQNDPKQVFKFVQVNSEDFFHINSYRPIINASLQQGNFHRFCSMNLPDIELLQNSEGIGEGKF